MPKKSLVCHRALRCSCWSALAAFVLITSCAYGPEGPGGDGFDDDPVSPEPGLDAGGPGSGADAASIGPAADAATSGAGADAGGTGGSCCADGDCLCHGEAPTALTSSKGPFATAQLTVGSGTVHYPTDAQPPFAAVAICAGFTNTGPEMASWGPFYASHGIVAVIVSTGGGDSPATRGDKLLAAIEDLEEENAKSTSPLHGDMSGRYGLSGYSYGGGGASMACAEEPSLRTCVGLAAHSGAGTGITVPSLLLCGQSDTTAACSMSQGDYAQIPGATPKMMISIPGANHFSWFGPTNAGSGMSGKYALAFQKVFLEGDERWRPLLLTMPGGGAVLTSNIAP